VNEAVHDLKCWPPFWGDIDALRKTFDVRRRDREFRVGDYLRLREYRRQDDVYTGRICFRRIAYILPGGRFGLDAGYCVLGLEEVADWERRLVAEIE